MHDVVNGKSPVQYYLIRKITDIYSYKCYNTIAAARKSLYQPRTRLNVIIVNRGDGLETR
jgi:hypothetical protein